MKIDDINAFVAVIRCQTISQAADSLQLTQPAITRRVQNFEEALGVELLDRNTKPLKPTSMGLRVYGQCLEVLRTIDALSELVANDGAPSGALRIGVPQTIGDVVLLDALSHLKNRYPQLQTSVATGWGSHLLGKVENGELDVVAALFPAGKVFPEGVIGRSLGSMNLVVVAAKGEVTRRAYKLADLYQRGWVLNPDGCGFRAGLQRALSAQGLSLQINLETFGTELQLGLIANGLGYGLVPSPLLENSSHRDKLEIVPVTDFKPVIDLWLIHPRFLGNLQEPVSVFGEMVAQRVGKVPGQ
ncbi:LysR family transcriptional regulator [Pseudomonas gingeri]|uniref:LysR family transcriptional regulator n=1 Tax=Pseudomonas gingeri TaxID=117681 RepID=UPI0015A1D140|nr:LysR family transcriptional regulator [Pseudomonas gingeri]NVZ63504.1 LysR family transcriptional regulator [Pseudomonas gingeri]NVZ76199.1 LysR family transcriptional regulator [Pseudomonas gingeri]NWA10576.1 LysR family transcriptional regulator [Pseudomonas gingeri]